MLKKIERQLRRAGRRIDEANAIIGMLIDFNILKTWPVPLVVRLAVILDLHYPQYLKMTPVQLPWKVKSQRRHVKISMKLSSGQLETLWFFTLTLFCDKCIISFFISQIYRVNIPDKFYKKFY